ncbi:Uncharacterised protein [uncultured archaeon]|nr:Uncharacterised protein [uncultured archaeon]
MGMPEFKDADYDRKLEEYKKLKLKILQERAAQGNNSNRIN